MGIEATAEVLGGGKVHVAHVVSAFAAQQIEGGIVGSSCRSGVVEMKAEGTHTAGHHAVAEHQGSTLEEEEAAGGACGGEGEDGAATGVANDITSGVGGGVAWSGDGGGGAIRLAVNGQTATSISNGDGVARVILDFDIAKTNRANIRYKFAVAINFNWNCISSRGASN